MILDLGCGGNLHEGAVGIDLIGPPNSAATIICNLGFERIPFDDSSVKKCISHHFIEHLPGVVTYRENGQWHRHNPLVFLFNEVYRVLEPGGIFSVVVPVVINGFGVHQQPFQDPTHLSFWVPETPRYFSGDYYSFHHVYGHTSRFEMIRHQMAPAHFHGWWMEFDLIARKEYSDDYPYQLQYP